MTPKLWTILYFNVNFSTKYLKNDVLINYMGMRSRYEGRTKVMWLFLSERCWHDLLHFLDSSVLRLLFAVNVGPWCLIWCILVSGITIALAIRDLLEVMSVAIKACASSWVSPLSTLTNELTLYIP
ncbi:hypothetical protein VCUG_02513 [Vavraia culicis subsp. floridensis]|uniref:Uncharacterized protein n=1 Tax=Vavraia culicis (isolate floridensis) TaxID=948595 RepID=L2GRK1_VAVCU|nr:uncharacterized protein VCUG_02513 [Vavraia culicis subsp. floridensis]ELA46002.1 hypothetical protein VCUG_02513 [Vavraia culicis subsp. floridensis]